jgi:hypothetical protein
MDFNRLKSKDVADWHPAETQLIVETILNKIKSSISPDHLDLQIWRRIADGRMEQLAPGKENEASVELKQVEKCNSEYIRSLSL